MTDETFKPIPINQNKVFWADGADATGEARFKYDGEHQIPREDVQFVFHDTRCYTDTVNTPLRLPKFRRKRQHEGTGNLWDPVAFADQLDSAITARGISQAEAGRRCRVTRQTINRALQCKSLGIENYLRIRTWLERVSL